MSFQPFNLEEKEEEEEAKTSKLTDQPSMCFTVSIIENYDYNLVYNVTLFYI